MNREEQIRETALEYTDSVTGLDYIGVVEVMRAFQAGARWADSHPQEKGMEMWAVREDDGMLFFALEKPYRNEDNVWAHDGDCFDGFPVLPEVKIFDFITPDNSPMKVRLIFGKEYV